ncbi:hypothetical protein EHS25_005051 [Saitozyma podzolica]|uniref:Uncharacterized protein n=1 Tax=Saitozyma podzolica TaxID=1890683 RepID=A0A427Y285_9TREE|nr:hypothetical protein EHS25_005051 [Saitozyma podzolica]
MSDLPTSPRTALFGAHRPASNPRLHAISKPYVRPASFSEVLAGPSNGGFHTSPTKSPAKPLPTTRPALPKSSSVSSLPRSGSDSSLFSGLRSMLSRPLAWLATPSRAQPAPTPHGTKRDSLLSFGQDLEDPESPSDRRQGKRVRRFSPPRGDYEPSHMSVEGRAVTGFMIPPLPPHVRLEPKSQTEKASSSTTNFSRPLPSSRSMPYLDPPSGLLSSPARNTRNAAKGALTRSRRIELAGLGDDEDSVGEPEREKSPWSPWKERQAAASIKAATPPGRRGTPTKERDSRDYTLPSLSPFKPRHAPSPLRQTGSLSGLTRSATTANLQRASSVVSDVSLGRGSARGLGRSGSMLFTSVNGDREPDEDRMSVDADGEHGREGSVLDWFMRDRWGSREREPGSPASAAASRRLGSLAPSSANPAIRKGQLVWNGDKGFVRESELRAAEQPKPVPSNEAERILFALESMRKTPLTEARSSTSFSSDFGLPPELVGSSSRQLRKAINVPLATAQAGESAKRRRDRDRLGEDYNVMISPYGRRRQVDSAVAEARSQARARSTTSDMDVDYRPPSRSPTASADERSERSSQASEFSERTPSEMALSPGHTPRRSSRLKRSEPPAEEEATPKARKTRGKAPPSVKKAAIETTTPKETPRRTRKATAEKATSPIPTVPVPTITQTAPSPGERKDREVSSYQPRADGEVVRGSSLRARSALTKRTHTASASYHGSREVSPSTGRFSAKEEDLPPMEDLEQAKISFSGANFSQFGPLPSAPSPTPASAEAPTANGPSSKATQSSLAVPSAGRGPLSRLSASRPRASSPLASGKSIVAAPESPPSAAPAATAPPAAPAPARIPAVAPVPTENGFGFFPLSASGPASGTTTPSKLPPASLFAGIGESKAEPKKSFGLGLGKPPGAAAGNEAGVVPDFFGEESQPASGTATPVPAPSFTFGTAKPAEPTGTTPAPAAPAAPAAPGFSFGAQTNGVQKPAAQPATTGFSFGATKPAEPAAAAPPSTFSFGSAKPADAPQPSLTFGGPSPGTATPSTEKPAEPSKTSFSFGAPSTPAPGADKPAEAPKPSFSFGAPAAVGPKSAEVAKPAFTFGAPSSSATAAAKPTETPQPAFSFGAASTPSSAPSAPPAAAGSSFGGFTFGKTAEAPKSAEAPKESTFGSTSSTGFTFGSSSTAPSSGFGAAKPNGAAEPAKSGTFTFGAPAAESAKASPFGSAPSSPAPTSTPAFSFGQSSTAAPQANGTTSGFTFGAPASSSGTSGFGTSAAAASPAASKPASTFTFGASSNAPSPGFGTSAPAANPFASSQPAQPAQPAAAAAPSPAPAPSGGFSFTFGQGANTSAGAAPGSTPFTFGGAPSAAPAPTTPTAAPSASFAFGASAPSQPSFGFGQTTTPSAAPPSGAFTFGAPAGGGMASGEVARLRASAVLDLEA